MLCHGATFWFENSDSCGCFAPCPPSFVSEAQFRVTQLVARGCVPCRSVRLLCVCCTGQDSGVVREPHLLEVSGRVLGVGFMALAGMSVISILPCLPGGHWSIQEELPVARACNTCV